MVISKVRKMGEDRKVIEVPKAVRNEYPDGEEVEFQKVRKTQKETRKRWRE